VWWLERSNGRPGRLPETMRGRAIFLALAAGTLTLTLALASPAAAATPQIGETWMTEVSAGSASFHGEINPEGASTTYRFEYATDAAFQEKEFSGAAKAPASGSASAGAGSGLVTVSQHVSALKSNTTYHYRLSATNGSGTTLSTPPQTFTTQGITGAFKLPDSRGWEMVSPADKNGGAIQGFGENHGGGVLQAAASGSGEITYTSSSSFGNAPQGAPQGSQYISTRHGEAGWSTQNITTQVLSGSYGSDPNGVPYQLFSPDLSAAVMLNGVRCRGEGADCPVANAPLAGTDAPAGFQNYYLRDNEDGSFSAVLTSANDSELGLSAQEFNLAFAGASPDLRHVILSTCAALTATATEVAGSEGCEPSKPNLYEYSSGQLALVNVNPGAALAAQSGAVSTDGQRVYFTEAGKLWLREGLAAPFELAEGGEFQTATPTGSLAFYTKAEHLYLYATASHSSTDLTPSGGVIGVLGAAEDGSRVYYATAAGIFTWHGSISTVTAIPGAATESDYPPATATTRVSADGNRLLFLSKAELTGYDNHDATSGLPDSEVFLYDASGAGSLACLSCNPTNERPIGPSSIPGVSSNGEEAAAGEGEIVTASYKPRVLSATANRVFFDSSDALVALDTNKGEDVYQWEAQGTGSCDSPGGCQSLISTGTDPEGASFIDASESGEDAYFLTSVSPQPPPGRAVTPAGNVDPGSADLYDARSGGGFAEPAKPIPCEGDACVPLPQGPEDPTVGSLIPGVPDPPVHFPKVHHKCPKGKRGVTRHGKSVCVAKGHKEKRHKRGRR
jgi:hypothetical protein